MIKKKIHILENNDINYNFKKELIAKTYQINDKLDLLGVCENYITNSDEIIFLIKGNPIFQYENNENIFNLLYSINYEQEIIFNKNENQNKNFDFNISNESIFPVNISLSKINNSNSVSRINKISSLLIRVFDNKINEIKKQRARSANRKIYLEKVFDKKQNKEMKKSKSNNNIIINNKLMHSIKEDDTDLNYNSLANQSIHLVEFNIDKPNKKLEIPIINNILNLESIIKIKEDKQKLNIKKENNFNYINDNEQNDKKFSKEKKKENIRKSQESENFISKFFENTISSQNNILKKENNFLFNSVNNKKNQRKNSQNSIYNQNSFSKKFENNFNDNSK
jgi:hypothetical protein